MNLVLDFGNTNIKLAVFNNGKLMELDMFREISLERIKDYLKKRPGIRNSILSSVIDYPGEINAFLQDSTFFIDLNENPPVPIHNLYISRNTLGKDRLAAAVGGAALFPRQNVLVINAGTCITYEFVNSEGEYLGGAISPGLEMRLKALNTFTDKLPLVSFTGIDNLIGDTTEKSILSGVFNGILAEIESITARYRDLYPDLNVILSGGDLNYFDNRLKISIFAFPNIVIHGLHQILEFNVTTAA
jgi:type III pantothenate kinase